MTDYSTSEEWGRFADALIGNGGNVAQACDTAGLPVSTYYRHREKPEYIRWINDRATQRLGARIGEQLIALSAGTLDKEERMQLKMMIDIKKMIEGKYPVGGTNGDTDDDVGIVSGDHKNTILDAMRMEGCFKGF